MRDMGPFTPTGHVIDRGGEITLTMGESQPHPLDDAGKITIVPPPAEEPLPAMREVWIAKRADGVYMTSAEGQPGAARAVVSEDVIGALDAARDFQPKA